ncbi:hypothetical protein [Embleya hyalina]|uniref:LPXTG cell wall anchor domain-containing protein n=1 Tax=Embleya hyalina TaxID=516124 RepID=A0A401Z3T9_9ACTN|nr:hypothetical protein [Embleya hyalina]GCE01508.1 hypothetical protein EHYA_09274 [Embleya hyalina]
MGRPIKRTAGGLAALAVMAGAMMSFAPQAGAATSNTTLKCDFSDPTVKAAMGGKDSVTGPQAFTVTGPAEGTAGSSIKLNIDPGVSPASSPLGTTVKITPTVTFTAKYEGGSAVLTAVGATLDLPLTANAGIDVPSFAANVALPAKAAGKVDLLPKTFALKIDVADPKLTLNVPCTVTDASPQPAFSVTLPAASTTGGSTSSGSTSSGSTSSGSTSSGSTSSSSTSSTGTSTSGTTAGNDSLAKTGPMDDALSMGLLGGTVGLLGVGGVLLATRRVRSSRNA